MEKHYKAIFGFWAIALVLICTPLRSQTPGGANGVVFRFTKQVWLNPSIILAKQNFEQSTNVKLLILPRLNSNDTVGNSKIEKAFDMLLSFLVFKENVQGSIKFYFNPKNPYKPFTFNTSEELKCKFTPVQRDSVETILNKDIINSNNLDNFTALPFDSIINRASRYCKKVLQSRPGPCGDAGSSDFTLTKINSTPAKLNFEKGLPLNPTAPNGGVDRKQYAELEQYYNVVLDVADNSNYPLAWKAMTATGNDVIRLKLKKKDPGFDLSRVAFKNANGTETYNVSYSHVSSDSTIDLGISGKSPGSMAEVVAYYTPTTTPTQTFAIGAFNVQFYEPKTMKVVLVSLSNTAIPPAYVVAVTSTLNAVYSNVFVKWTVETATCPLPNGMNKAIHVQSSGLLSNYMPDMQDIVSHFKDNCTAYKSSEANTYYLLYGCTNDGNLAGYMPRARNTGFIFDTDARTAAHELGHGAFNLKHIFSSDELGEGNKTRTDNVMDYAGNSPNGQQLAIYKHQWDQIHNPGFVGWFEGDDEEGAEIAGGGRVICYVPDIVKPGIDYSKYLPYKHSDGNIYYIKLSNNQKIKTLYYTYNKAYIRSIEITEPSGTKIYVDDDDAAVVITPNNNLPTGSVSHITFHNSSNKSDLLTFSVTSTLTPEQKLDLKCNIKPDGQLGLINPSNNLEVVFTCENNPQNIITPCASNYLYTQSQMLNGSTPLNVYSSHLQSALANNQTVDGRNNFENVIINTNTYILPNMDAGSASPTSIFINGDGNADLEGINNKLTYLEAATGYKLFVQFSNMGCDVLHSELKAFTNNIFTNTNGDKSKIIYLFVVKNKNSTTYTTYSVFGTSIKETDVNIIKNYIGNYEQDHNGISRNDFKNYLNNLYERIPKKKVTYKIFIEKGDPAAYSHWKRNYDIGQPTPVYTNRLFKTFKVEENKTGKAITLEYYLVTDLFSNMKVEKISNYHAELKEQYINDDAIDLTLIMISMASDKFNWGLKAVKSGLSGLGTNGSTGNEVRDNTPHIFDCHFEYNKNCTLQAINAVFDAAAFVGIVLSAEAGLVYEAGLLATRGVYSVMTDQPTQLNQALIQFGFTTITVGLINAAGPILKSATNLILVKCPAPIKNYILALKFKSAFAQTEQTAINSIIESTSPVYSTFLLRTPSNSVYILRGSNGEFVVGRLIKENINGVTTDVVEIIGRKQNTVIDIERATTNQIDNAIAEAEIAISRRAGLLTKYNSYPSIQNWINGLDETADAALFTKLEGFDPNYYARLESDIASISNGASIKALLKENPDDLTNIWKLLKDDPKYSFELAKTGGSRWEKWAQGNFFKSVTKAGKDFEIVASNQLQAASSPLKTKLASKYNINIDQYEVFEQVQIKTGQTANGTEEYFIADFVLVKKIKNDFGDLLLDYNQAVILETKLSSTTPLTTPQTNALAKVKTTSNSFDVRSISEKGKFNSSYTLGNTNKVKITDYIKVHSDGLGTSVQDIISLK